MIVCVSRARLRRDRADGAFEFLIATFGPTWAEPSFYTELREATIDSTVEYFETIAERYEDLKTLGLDHGLES